MFLVHFPAAHALHRPELFYFCLDINQCDRSIDVCVRASIPTSRHHHFTALSVCCRGQRLATCASSMPLCQTIAIHCLLSLRHSAIPKSTISFCIRLPFRTFSKEAVDPSVALFCQWVIAVMWSPTWDTSRTPKWANEKMAERRAAGVSFTWGQVSFAWGLGECNLVSPSNLITATCLSPASHLSPLSVWPHT